MLATIWIRKVLGFLWTNGVNVGRTSFNFALPRQRISGRIISAFKIPDSIMNRSKLLT